MPADLVLIGPLRAGKSTLANLLAERLDVPRVSLDQHRWRYYADAGYDRAQARSAQRSEGFAGLYRHKKPFEARAVCRLLAEFAGCIFDFGASHSVYEDEALFELVRAALAPYENVVLVLPAADPRTSIRVLKERTGGLTSGGMDFVEHFVKHPSNASLAKLTVYTEGKTPEQTCEEILRRAALQRQPAPPPKARTIDSQGGSVAAALARRPITRPLAGANVRGAGRLAAGAGAARSCASGESDDPGIDRSCFRQHRQLAERRLGESAAAHARLDALRAEQRHADLERLKNVVEKPLPEFARCFVNDCLGEVDTAVAATLLGASLPGGARLRAARLFARRLPLAATLRDVLALDPRDGLLPTHDAQTLAMLRNPELPQRVRAAQREALRDRFLRMAQQSSYPFLHEVIAGWFANVLERDGAVKHRRDLRISDAVNELSAYFVSELARAARRSPGEIAALHFAESAFIDEALSEPMRDLLLTSAEVAMLLEPVVVYGWRDSPRRLVGQVLLFFSIPTLERFANGGPPSLSQDAGPLLRARIAEMTNAHDAPNELDVAAMLRSLCDEIWSSPERSTQRAVLAG